MDEATSATGNETATGTWWDSYAECPLMDMSMGKHRIRLVSELIILVGAFLYLMAALREARFLGNKMFFENLVSPVVAAPSQF